MALEQGLSGLAAANNQLDVIGNNIANSGTVGFKSGSVQFADVYASSFIGAGAPSAGIGVQTASTVQNFSQGTITTSTNPLDMAISGAGFFQVSTNGSPSYTRDGQFQLDKSGNLVTASGSNVMGYAATAAGTLSAGSPTPININTSNLAPAATSTVTTELNLDSRLPTLTPASFSSTDPTTYSYSTSVSVYDSLGNSHALQTYYVKGPVTAATGDANWSVFATNDGIPVGYTPPAAPVPIATLSFSPSGALDTTSAGTTGPTYAVPLTITSGAVAAQTVTMSFAGTTQFGSTVGVNAQTQNGYTSGQLSTFTAGADGKITGTYSNGQTALLGQIALANFVNPNGLQSIGGNQYIASSTSGAPLVGAPETGGLGTLESSAVEGSNTDLTTELVDMITAQRNYQANAQTLKTEDQIMQTLVTLR